MELRTLTEMPAVLRSVLDVVEEALAGHGAFGDSGYILNRFHADSLRRLDVIGRDVPSARELSGLLKEAEDEKRTPVLGNTVVRGAIQHAHVRVAGDDYGLPLADCAEIFERSAQSLRRGDSSVLFEAGPHGLPRVDSALYRGWVWSEEYPRDVMGRAYRSLIERNWGATLGTPREEDLAALEEGMRLLEALMPLLGRSALRHVHFIGIFDQGGGWRRTASSSTFTVGGTILLARSLLRNPWSVAEHVLHEALHQKLYDFRHGHSLLGAEAIGPGAPRILSPWNPAELSAANNWDVHRAFAAFHVYVQLTVLALVAEWKTEGLQDRYGPPTGLVASQKAYERAWYLGEKLREEPNWGTLGLAGQRMVDWLQSVLPCLDLPEPPRDAKSHLHLDLYWREARGVCIDETSPATKLARLAGLARDEIELTRAILRNTENPALLDRFNEEISHFPEDALGPSFVAIREGIAWTLRNATADGYMLRPGPSAEQDPNQQLRRMTVDGSQRLHAILHDLPDSVANAKRRAHALRFGASCIDGVGRLLATLAAAVPPGGRILEIGTGVGVGLGWILSGLQGRADVEVVSIETDPKLAEAALQADLPPGVRIVEGDAAEHLPALGMFDLLFVDASPFKHGFIDQCIELLRPRGALVVDDFHVGDANPEAPEAVQNKLRTLLLDHPALKSVELDYASGVVLATRVTSSGSPS